MTDREVRITFDTSEARTLLAAAKLGGEHPAHDNWLYGDQQALNRAVRKLELLTTNDWGDDKP